jgi:hypothetical protein
MPVEPTAMMNEAQAWKIQAAVSLRDGATVSMEHLLVGLGMTRA